MASNTVFASSEQDQPLLLTSKGAAIDVQEFSRLLQQSFSLLDSCRHRFGEAGVSEVLAAELVVAIPQVLEILKEFNYEADSLLREDSLSCLGWLVSHGCD